MALVAGVENGKIVESASQSSLKKAESAASNDMDKDAFLQLLVAQMKYQDPLQPTSNTEYISQYAQFSQVEQLQNMAASTDLARASSLVGQEVYIKTTASNGETKYVQGKVDYVVFENGEAFLSIDEALYSLSDLDTIVDKNYQQAYDKAYDFTVAMNKLPAVAGIDMTDADEIEKLQEIYNGMSDYEKGFIATDTEKLFNQYVERLEELKRDAEDAAKKAAEEAKKAEEASKAESAGDAGSDKPADTTVDEGGSTTGTDGENTESGSTTEGA